MEKIENIYNIAVSEKELHTIKMAVKTQINRYKKAIDEQYNSANDKDPETAEDARWCIRNNQRLLADLEKIARELEEIEQ